jgi:hypothetical protein
MKWKGVIMNQSENQKGFKDLMVKVMATPCLHEFKDGVPTGIIHDFQTSLVQTGNQEILSTIQKDFGIADALEKLTKSPIISVMGQMKAGKSSVVSSFISQKGKNRIPRGIYEEHATHRFVYWLPASWKKDGRDIQILNLIREGHNKRELEALSENPEQSHRQYSSGLEDSEKIQTPLFAFDERLEEFAFLDCPDFQTYEKAHDHRLKFVLDSARLCSAFLFIMRQDSLKDNRFFAALGELRGNLPNLNIYLLINRLDPAKGEPDRTMSQNHLVDLITKIQAKAVYSAFDFKIQSSGDEPGWRDLTPEKLVDRLGDSNTPHFFLTHPKVEKEHCPEFLMDLPSLGGLDPAELQKSQMITAKKNIHAGLHNAVSKMEAWIVEREAALKHAHRKLLNICINRVYKSPDGKPLQNLNQNFLDALRESVCATAPWYLKVGLWSANVLGGVKKNAAILCGNIKKGLGNLNPFNRARELAEGAEEKIKNAVKLGDNQVEVDLAVHNPNELASYMIDYMDIHAKTNQASVQVQVAKAWEKVIAASKVVELSYDRQKLDKLTADFWKELPAGKKWGMFFLGNLVTMLLALALVAAPIDGGAGVFATMSVQTTMLSLIPGAAAAGFVVGGAFANFLVEMIRLGTLPSLSSFHAFACDAFNLPRRLVSPEKTPVPLTVTFKDSGGKDMEFVIPEPQGQQKIEVVYQLGESSQWLVSCGLPKIN